MNQHSMLSLIAQAANAPFWERPQFVVTALIAVGSVFLITLLLVTVARFYRRCGADEALVRTGAGGTKVVIGGGVTVFPILHQLLRVSLRSIKLSVDRSGAMALVTRDKIRANVTTELYIKVEPIADDVMAAARSFGERNLDEHAIGDLIEGKLTDALRSVAANSSFMELHTNRKDFAESIQKVLAEELKKNGLTLENVSITSLAMVPVKDLNASEFFDSEGLMTITEQVKANARKTNQIEREAEVAIREQNVISHQKVLEADERDRRNEADQTRRVQEYAATQAAATAAVVYEQQRAQETAALQKQQAVETAALQKQQAVETARIEQMKAVEIAEAMRVAATREAQIASEKAQQAALIAKEREIEAANIEKMKTIEAANVEKQKTIEAAEIEKQKTIEAAEIEKQKTIETARVAKQIAVTNAMEIEARAEALKATAEAERQQATQAIITVEETAKARREREIAIIKAEEAAQKSRIDAEREAFARRLEAETSAAAVKARADGEAAAKHAEASGEIARAEGAAKSQQLRADAAAAVIRTEAQAEADRVRISAEARAKAAHLEAEALIALAEATRKKGEAEADARRKLVEAENQVATKFLLKDVALKAIEVLPEVTKELMTPAKAISEIKVLQMSGGPAVGASADGAPSAGAFGAASPVLKTVLEAGAAFPLLRELMQFAQVDTNKLADSARKLVGALPDELKKIAAEDPALAAKLASLSPDTGGEGIKVRPADDAAPTNG
jgi:uncharacterized membrane protein YqiK